MNKRIVTISLALVIVCCIVLGIFIGTFIESNRLNKESIAKKLEIDRAAYEAMGVEKEQIEIALKAQKQRYIEEISSFWTRWLPVFVSFGALIISGIFLFWNVIVEWGRRRANLEMWQRNDFFMGSEDDRTIINLLFRNKSYRVTAVIELYIRGKAGNVLGGHGYKGRVELPIQIDAWNVERRSFRIERTDEQQMKDIKIRDIDDNEIVYDRSKGKKWVKSEGVKPKKEKGKKKKRNKSAN